MRAVKCDVIRNEIWPFPGERQNELCAKWCLLLAEGVEELRRQARQRNIGIEAAMFANHYCAADLVHDSLLRFPPTYLVTGTRDLFLSDVVRVHRKMRVAGVVADLNVYEGVSHGGYGVVMDSPELQQVFGELGAFLLKHLQ